MSSVQPVFSAKPALIHCLVLAPSPGERLHSSAIAGQPRYAGNIQPDRSITAVVTYTIFV
jgi:hypothetical protein